VVPRRSHRACVLLVLAGVSRPAAAADPEAPAPDPARPSYRLDFRADKVELEGEGDRVELSGDVVVRADRYRLTSQRLRIERGPRGVIVDGAGRVAFCPCPEPPVSIGFESATMAPPTDLLLEQPTLRVGDVPVAWLPYFWLRSPDRIGVLPPRIAWRGDDGLLAGAGVHVPFGARPERGRRDSVDIMASGYFKGGVEIETRLETATTSGEVRWDHLDESLLAVDAHGSLTGPNAAVLAWQVDALRGARGRRGTILLDPAARRYDRLSASVGTAESGGVLGFAVKATDARARAIDAHGLVGPELYAGAGTALDGAGRAEASVSAYTATSAQAGTLTLMEQRSEIGLDARPGPLSASVEIGERLVGAATEAQSGGGLRAGGALEVALPLERAFGDRQDPLLHRIEPFVQGSGMVTRSEDLPVGSSEPLGDGELASAGAGLRNRLGAWGSRSAASVEARGGYAGEPRSPSPVLALEASGDSELWALRGEAAWLPDTERALAVAARSRLGRVDGYKLVGYAEGRRELEPQLARWFQGYGWRGARHGWFDRAGWTVGGELGMPWTDILATAVGADYDATARELLAVRGTLGYRHRCGCLAVLTWVGHRIGREGIDVWATLDLLP
jgi:hypothetical protein